MDGDTHGSTCSSLRLSEICCKLYNEIAFATATYLIASCCQHSGSAALRWNKRFPEHEASVRTSSEIALDTLLVELGASVKVDCENIISVYMML